MKTQILLCITLFVITSTLTHATVRTVSNDGTRPAQFNGAGNIGFINAQTASVAGDTIYIYGSPFAYGTISVTKRLVVIGAGYGPNNQFGQPTRIGGLEIFRDGSTSAASSVFTGLLIEGQVSLTGTLASNNITIFRCRVNGYIYPYNGSNHANNWTIYNNIVNGVWGNASSRTSTSSTNIIIANNIIINSIGYFNSNTVLIDHNIFLSANNLWQMFNVIVTNNIFTRTSSEILFGEVVFCTFNKNISNQNTIGSAPNYSPTNIFEATWTSTGGGSNSGAGNLVGTNPLYTNVTDFNTYSATANYRLQATSPGKAPFSTDGTDAGIYGGSFPFPSGGADGSGFDTSPMPPIPQVTSVNIQNAVIQPNGTLNVQVQGKVNN